MAKPTKESLHSLEGKLARFECGSSIVACWHLVRWSLTLLVFVRFNMVYALTGVLAKLPLNGAALGRERCPLGRSGPRLGARRGPERPALGRKMPAGAVKTALGREEGKQIRIVPTHPPYK